MDILIETATGGEVKRWSGLPGKVNIPGSGDVVFCGSVRPMDIGPNHFLATAVVVEPSLGPNQKRGPETIDVAGRVVTVTRPAVGMTAQEIDDEKSALALIILNEPGLKAYAACINDGSIVPGANHSNAFLKAAVKAKL